MGPRACLDGGKSRPIGIRSPDRPARSQSLSRLSYSAHFIIDLTKTKYVFCSQVLEKRTQNHNRISNYKYISNKNATFMIYPNFLHNYEVKGVSKISCFSNTKIVRNNTFPLQNFVLIC